MIFCWLIWWLVFFDDIFGVQDTGEVRPACLSGVPGHPAGLLPWRRGTKMFSYRLPLLVWSVFISQKSLTCLWILSFLIGLKPFTVANSNWTQLQSDWGLVRSWAEERGVTRFAVVGESYYTMKWFPWWPGTCWGSYMTLRMSSLPEVIAGVGSVQNWVDHSGNLGYRPPVPSHLDSWLGWGRGQYFRTGQFCSIPWSSDTVNFCLAIMCGNPSNL